MPSCAASTLSQSGSQSPWRPHTNTGVRGNCCPHALLQHLVSQADTLAAPHTYWCQGELLPLCAASTLPTTSQWGSAHLPPLGVGSKFFFFFVFLLLIKTDGCCIHDAHCGTFPARVREEPDLSSLKYKQVSCCSSYRI